MIGTVTGEGAAASTSEHSRQGEFCNQLPRE